MLMFWTKMFVNMFTVREEITASKREYNIVAAHSKTIISFCLFHKFFIYLRGTQLPNLSGNSEMRSSLTLSFSGPRMMTGLVYCICNCCTASYDNTVSSPPARINNMGTQRRTVSAKN